MLTPYQPSPVQHVPMALPRHPELCLSLAPLTRPDTDHHPWADIPAWSQPISIPRNIFCLFCCLAGAVEQEACCCLNSTQTCTPRGTKTKNRKPMEICRDMTSLGLQSFGGSAQKSFKCVGSNFWQRFWWSYWTTCCTGCAAYKLKKLSSDVMAHDSLDCSDRDIVNFKILKWYLNKLFGPRERLLLADSQEVWPEGQKKAR